MNDNFPPLPLLPETKLQNLRAASLDLRLPQMKGVESIIYYFQVDAQKRPLNLQMICVLHLLYQENKRIEVPHVPK